MGDDDGATGESQEGVFQRAKGFDVQVVGRLVQQEEVAALLEGQGQVQAVTLTARKDACGLLLVRALKAERRDVGARGHLDVADLNEVEAVGDDLPQGLVGVDAGASLVDVADLDGLADRQLTAVERLQTDDRLKQRGLTDTVGADDAHDAVARQREGQAGDERAIAKALLEILGLDDHVAQARARRDLDFLEVELAGAFSLGGHFLVAGQTRLRLGLAPLGVRADPLELFLEALGQLGILLPLDLQTLLLGLQVGRVVALVGVEVTAVNLGDPAGDVVEEVAVVSDGDDRARIGREVLLQPEDGLGVQVVGRLVEEQQVGRLDEELAQRDAAALATRQDGDRLIRRRTAQRVHRLIELRVDVPRVGSIDLGLQLTHLVHQGIEVGVRVGHLFGDLIEAGKLGEDVGRAQTHVFDDGLRLVQDRLLHENADRVAGRQASLAIAGLVQAGHDLQDRGLAGAIGTDHADLGSREEGHGDIVEDDLVTDSLASLDHLINKLRHVTPFGWFGARTRARVPPYRSDPVRAGSSTGARQASVILISGPNCADFTPSARCRASSLVTPP